MALYGTGSNITNTTDVAAGNYGSANAVPRITVDANGRISAINTNAITITAAINANASVGDIGTYAFMQQSSGNTQYAPGATLAGSSLRYSDATGRIHTTTPSGNWRCMGYDSGAALVNTGTGTGTGTGSGSISDYDVARQRMRALAEQCDYCCDFRIDPQPPRGCVVTV